MKDQWRADLTGDGRPPTPSSAASAAARSSTTHPNWSSRSWFPTARTPTPMPQRTAAEHTMFTVAVGAAVQALLVALAVRGVGSCWIGSTIFAADLVRVELDLPADWEPLGAIAIGYPCRARGPTRPLVPTDGLLVRRVTAADPVVVSLHQSAVDR